MPRRQYNMMRLWGTTDSFTMGNALTPGVIMMAGPREGAGYKFPRRVSPSSVLNSTFSSRSAMFKLSKLKVERTVVGRLQTTIMLSKINLTFNRRYINEEEVCQVQEPNRFTG